MSVLDRSALVESPLADLHAIASELSIDGYRRLRRDDLIAAIIDKQGGGDGASAASAETDEAETSSSRRRRGRRGGRGRGATREQDEQGEADVATEADDEGEEEAAPKPRRSRSRAKSEQEAPEEKGEPEEKPARAESEEKPARGRRSRAKAEPEAEAPAATAGDEEPVVEGTVELLANGSGFVRVAGNEPSDDDVYISSAQVKRCELVSGDVVAGPKRAPRRSERFASLIRVETINGRPASELADSVRFDDLPATLPTERLTLGTEDPNLQAIEWLTPFGRGSRVTITGAARAGKSEAIRRLASALAADGELTVTLALAGVRPEEVSQWSRDAESDGAIAPSAAVSFVASEDAQSSAIEAVVDQAKRLAARGAHAVVLIDTLDGVSAQNARKIMAGARNIVDGGSVTVIATSTEPVGGETTVIALDVERTSTGRFPSLDLLASGTLRPELLVGEAGAESITRTRREVLEGDVEE